MTPYQLRLCVFETLRRYVIEKCTAKRCAERLWCLDSKGLAKALHEVGERLGEMDLALAIGNWFIRHPPAPHVSVETVMRAFDQHVAAARKTATP